MQFGHVLMFMGIASLSSISCRNSAKGMIDRIGSNLRCFPKGYIAPPKWVRLFFKLKQKRIPIYLYFELLLSLVFALLGPINLFVFALENCSPNVGGLLMMIHAGLIIFDTIVCSVLSCCLTKK